MVQIHTVASNAVFTFTNSFDGAADTRYIKVGNSHFRKDTPGSCCIPISRCSIQIRTLVRPC